LAHGPTGRDVWPPDRRSAKRNKLCLDSWLFPRASAAILGLVGPATSAIGCTVRNGPHDMHGCVW